MRDLLDLSDEAPRTVADATANLGFPDQGEFAAQYEAHFGESPTSTRG